MKSGRRIVLWITAPVLTLLLIMGVSTYTFSHGFYPSPPEAAFPAADATTAQRQDFEYFHNYLELDRSYGAQTRAQAARMLAQYTARAGALSPAQFDLAIASMAALADNGHSQISIAKLSNRHNRLPCRLYRFADGYHVIRARAPCAELLGAKILKIDGRAIEEVVDHLSRYFGGQRNRYEQFFAVFLLESPELLQAAGLASATEHVSWHVLTRDGAEKDVDITAEPPNPDSPWAKGFELLSPQPRKNEPADWKPLLAANVRLPIFLRDFQKPFQSEHWADKATYYVQFRSNSDEKGYAIGEFVERVKREIIAQQPHLIVLDLRFDPGGDFTKTAALMESLTQLTSSINQVNALTSAWTFSAGISSLAFAKEHGGDKVTILGEPVGDRLRAWGEGGSLVLPHSKLGIHFARGLHDYTRSCFGEHGCYWLLYFHQTHLQTLAPDIRVPYSFDDYIQLRDPLLERALGEQASPN